jgi:hypothetical protein
MQKQRSLTAIGGAITAAFLAFVGATPALAGPEAGRFSGSIIGGTDVPVGGDVHGGATSAQIPLGGLNPALTGVTAELRIQDRSFTDIYDNATSFGIEGAYGLSDNSEVFGAIRRTEADKGRVQVGNAVVTASTVAAVPVGTSLPVNGEFGEYSATSIEGGYRRYFNTAGALQPYVAGRAGVVRTDEIKANFTVPAAGIALNNVPFYQESTTWTVGADVGISYAISEAFSVALETGVRFTGDLDGDDAGIGPLGLASINEEGARTSIPVMIRGTLKF